MALTYDEAYRLGYADGRYGLTPAQCADNQDAYDNGYAIGNGHRPPLLIEPTTYTGMLYPTQRNHFDGSYPQRWRDFYVDAEGDVRVVFEARTGGERDRLLSMSGQTVTIKGGKVLGKIKLACGEVETVRLA